MHKLSVVIITKNVEDLIADCMDSVSFADEVLVIDDQSNDKTVDIAKMQGAKVFSEHLVSFADKRNFGLKKAKYPWLLYIDADERVDQELASAIQEVLQQKKPSATAYKLKRKNFYLGRNEWPTVERMERFFFTENLEEWVGTLHETPKYRGEIGELAGYLLHYTHRDLSSMLQKTITWSGYEAKLRFDAHHPPMTWWRFPRVMLSAFYDSYVKQKGYKLGTAGLIESMFQAFSMFITYARLWEMQQDKK